MKSVISSAFISKNKLWSMVSKSTVSLKGLSNQPIENLGTIKLPIRFPNSTFACDFEFFVINFKQPLLLLGTDFFYFHNIDILFSQNCITGLNVFEPIFIKTNSKSHSISYNRLVSRKYRPYYCIANVSYTTPPLLYLNYNGELSYTRNYWSGYKGNRHVVNDNVENHKQKPKKVLSPGNIFLCQKTITIPPNAEAIFKTSIHNSTFLKLKNKQVLFQATKNNKSSPLFIASQLLHIKSRTIPLRVVNLSDIPVSINRFSYLGRFFDLDDDIELYPFDSSTNPSIHINSLLGTNQNLSESQMKAEILKIKESEPWISELRIGELTIEQEWRVHILLQQYRDVFSMHRKDIGKTNLMEAHLDVKSATPLYTKQYPIDKTKKAVLDEEIKTMQEMGIIEHTTSQFNSPLVLIKKPDSSYRVVVDFRRINEHLENFIYPLPTFESSMELLANNQFYSTLDMISAYFQIPLDKDSRKVTAFTCPPHRYQFTRMPYGLKNATSIFQKLMNLLLGSMQYKTALIYVDDAMIFSKNFTDHLVSLEELFQKMKSANLKFKPSKCFLFKDKVNFLGHIVGRDGIIPCKRKIEAVESWPTPRTGKHVKQFLGLCTYFRRFVPDFATIAHPLFELTKPKTRFHWGLEENYAFQTLKSLLINPPILAFPNPNQPYIVTTDCSGFACGAILSQLDSDGNERVISYLSRKLKLAERNYSATELEMLAVVYALEQFRCYLVGNKFRLITDHRPLLYLQTMKDPTSRHFRWILKIQNFDFTVEHRSGILHGSVDMLSRNPQYLDTEEKFKNDKVNLMKSLLVNEEAVKAWRQNMSKELNTNFNETDEIFPTKYETFNPNSFFEQISKIVSNNPDNFQNVRNAMHNLMSKNKKFLEKSGLFGSSNVTTHMKGLKNTRPAETIDIQVAASLLKLPIITKDHAKKSNLNFGFLETNLTCFPPPGSVIILETDQYGNWIWTNEDFTNTQVTITDDHTSKNDRNMGRKNISPGDKRINLLEELPGILGNTPDKVLSEDKGNKDNFTSAQTNLISKFSDKSHVRVYAVKTANNSNSAKALYIPNSQQIAACQLKDEYCLKWINFIKNNIKPKLTDNYFHKHKDCIKINKDGILVYFPKVANRKGESPPELIVLPLNLFKYVMESIHIYLSHIGRDKSMYLISQKYHRPGLKRLISKYVNNCQICQNKSGNRKRRLAEVQRIEPPNDRLECFSIDCVGPLISSQRRNKYIITMMDLFSRWVELVPVPNIKAETVAEKMLIHLFARFGIPVRIHSDNAQNFHSKLMKSICSVLNIKRTFTSALSPLSNGALEKFHLFLGNALKCTVSNNGRDWDQRLPHLLLAYRTTNHVSLEENPAWILYGKDLRLPTELLPPKDENPNQLDGHHKGNEVAIKFAEARDTYLDVMNKYSERGRKYANKNKFTLDLKVGDTVLMKKPLTKPNFSQKLHRSYVGEYRIIKKNSNVNYLIQEKNGRKRFKVHVNRIIKQDPAFIDQTTHWSQEAEDIFKDEEITDDVNISTLLEEDEEEDALIPCTIEQFISRNYE